MAASRIEARPGDHDDRAPLIIGAVTALMLISTLSVSLRIYTRKFLLDNLGLDDYLVIGGLVRCAVDCYIALWTYMALVGDFGRRRRGYCQ
jgi:hypothetical protein